jgi:SAM-dependent methyltransferase
MNALAGLVRTARSDSPAKSGPQHEGECMIGLWWRLIRFGFRLLYNEFAWTYDWVSWAVSLGRWRKWQQASLRYLDLRKETRVLELAHGTANLQLDLAKNGCTGVGLDLSPAMGRIARHKLRANGLDARLVRGSAMHLPFPDSSFFYIVSTFPTEFIVQPETIREVQRILKPGGRLVVVMNGLLTAANPVVWVLEWLYRVTGQRAPLPLDPFHQFRKGGLEPQLHIDDLPDSKVWILVAEKDIAT